VKTNAVLGNHMKQEKQGFKMSKGTHKLNFDKTIHTQKGVLYVDVLKQRLVEDACVTEGAKEVANVIEVEHEEAKKGKAGENKGIPTECVLAANPITIKKAHCMCGHMGQEEAREICNLYGQELTKQGFKQCNHCRKAKAKQLAVEQNNEEHIDTGLDEH
jgi:hypothetical protein